MIFQPFDDNYLQRLKEGDPYVERHFADYFGQLLLVKLRSRLHSWQLLEDARQETLLRVLQALREKGSVQHPERFGAFVNAVCNNVLLEMGRTEARDRPSAQEAPEPRDERVDLDAQLVTEERKRRVAAVLQELPEKDRELLKALFLDEKEKSEVCRQFQVDREYLRVLLYRAKSRFRKVLEQRSDRGSRPWPG